MIKTGNFLPPDRPAQGMRADEILQKGSGIDMKADIGEIICQCRQNRKMTQEEFASRLGVTPHEPAIIRLNQEKPTKSRVCTDLVLFI